ncbi:MAG TPA: TSUP family transporter, partial [Candidatus Saccharimonadales bacterium]|nr:TSUP family transporter [Candidatus Saccharimonadales bacterium]
MSSLQLIIYAAAAFGAAILSGIAGGGAGFINTPLLIFFGLSPAQAVATGKLTGLSLSVGSLGGLQSIPKKSKKELVAIMALAFVIGLAAPFVITNLDSAVYRRLLGILLLAMIPVLLFKKIGQVEQKSSRLKT